MISFFRNLNLARMIILLSIVGSGYLAWVNWQQYQELKDLRSTFAHQVAKVCTEIQEKSMLHTKLSRDIKGDRYVNEDSPDSYIRMAADNPQVNIGVPDINSGKSTRAGGIIDNTFTIRPEDRKREFTHDHVARFIYRLEAESPQVKVTKIKLDLLAKVKPDEIPPDAWTWELEMTNRVKDASRAPR